MWAGHAAFFVGPGVAWPWGKSTSATSGGGSPPAILTIQKRLQEAEAPGFTAGDFARRGGPVSQVLGTCPVWLWRAPNTCMEGIGR